MICLYVIVFKVHLSLIYSVLKFCCRVFPSNIFTIPANEPTTIAIVEKSLTGNPPQPDHHQYQEPYFAKTCVIYPNDQRKSDKDGMIQNIAQIVHILPRDLFLITSGGIHTFYCKRKTKASIFLCKQGSYL